MLTKLRARNFKAWKDTGEIRMAPLTVLFGANSAGKTSIPQLLLLLKQTADSPDRRRALQFGDTRTLVDAGTFDDVVHNHDVGLGLEFGMSWALEEVLDVVDPLTRKKYRGEAISFQVDVRADAKHQPFVQAFRYALQSDLEPVLDVEMKRRDQNGKFDLVSQRYQFVRHQGRPWPLPEPERFYGFPDEATAYYQNSAFLADLVLSLKRMLGSVYYLGPLREYPRRLYQWSGEVPDHVGMKGERAVEAILAAGRRSFNIKPKQKTRSLAELVAERLRAMGLIRDFSVRQLGEHRKEYEVLVRTAPRLPEVKLTDVGFGVSQVLPVIVQCFYVPAHSIVILEQPEIHLHPRVQAELADLFIDAIRARESGVTRSCQFIIESHSEHFLRRLQRRIAEGELRNEDAAMYFAHTVGDSAKLEPLDIDVFGNIRNWPDGFFGDEMGDLVARAEAQAQRDRQEPNL